MNILLAGNPNCGKTTLFNVLTGDNQRVGNWPGVTVEKKTGLFEYNEQQIEVTDLPGIYSLACSENASQDEKIASHALINLPADLIINIIDACHLERHLYLTSQLLELNKPTIIALNMMDIAEQRGIKIDIQRLSKQLNCPVIALQAHKKIGIQALQQRIIAPPKPAHALYLNLDDEVEQQVLDLSEQLVRETEKKTSPGRFFQNNMARYFTLRMLEGDATASALFTNAADFQDYDVLLADARYAKIHHIVSSSQKKSSDASNHLTAKIDKIVLHRYLALPIFLCMMYLMFLFAINIGGAFQDFFDITTNTLFVQGTAWLLQQIHAPYWLIALLANGVGVGINTTLTFIPVIAAMFFFLSLLETSGYMARAAFVVDKIMRILGLPGKAFVPMIVGFGCNVPAIMAARTLDSERDRLLTVLMSPFMSCSARLAIYAVFVSAFFPSGGQNIVFSLYLLGILMAVLTGFMLRKTTFQGEASPLILELPAYHYPSWKRLFKETSLRLHYFISRAGRMILPVCVILGGLNALTIDGGFSNTEASAQSVLSLVGQWLTPVFSPMGLTPDNWPATVGLLTGMLAKEVVVGTLNSLYAQVGHLAQTSALDFHCLASLKEALWSIPQNLAELGSALLNPIVASAPDNEVSQSVYGMMAERFDGKVGAYAYLLFVLLYIPCVSTMAAIRQEANKALMYFSVIWSFLLAYAAAVIFYQLATINSHPWQSMAWVASLAIIIYAFISQLKPQRLGLGDAYATSHS